MNVEQVVRERYTQAAQEREPALCCPVTYDPKWLAVIPKEILEKDYGCGDPSAYLCEGETVLDLGSGAGKVCFIASQRVGPKGRVIGIDGNPAMLSLANRHKAAIAEKIGWQNVTFRYGHIQDLRTDMDLLEAYLAKNPVKNATDFIAMKDVIRDIQKAPLIPDATIDTIISNCVLNLVRIEDKKTLFKEMIRVLKTGGHVAISDIVSNQAVPERMQNDPKLWSGCLSGAFEEKAFLGAFEEAGFHDVRVDKRDEEPWQVVQGIEFRSVTVVASKGPVSKTHLPLTPVGRGCCGS